MTPRPCECSKRGCKHFRGPIGPYDDVSFICVAYPRGIPEEIVIGKDKHEELRGDEDSPLAFTPGGVARL